MFIARVGDKNGSINWGIQSNKWGSINRHIRNIYRDGELDEKRTLRKNRIVQKEGNRNVTREVKMYNLDAIISVGYQIK